MTDTWQSASRTCWHLDEWCQCGGRLATSGTDVWCTACGKRKTRQVRCEVYSRIVGYLRPVQNWNDAKKLEFEERRVYETPLQGDLEVM